MNKDERRAGDGSWQVYGAPEADDVEREGGDTSRGGTSWLGRLVQGAEKRRVAAAVGVVVGLAAVSGAVVLVQQEAEERAERVVYDQIVDRVTYDEIVAAVERLTGGTEVVQLSVQRNYYSDPELLVELPPQDSQPLVVTYEWVAGELEYMWANEADDEVPVDLERIDPDLLVQVDEMAHEEAGEAIRSATIRVNNELFTSEPEVEVESYLQSVDGDSYVLRTDLDGEVTHTQTW